MSLEENLKNLKITKNVFIEGIPTGFEIFAVEKIWQSITKDHPNKIIIFVTQDNKNLDSLAKIFNFINPSIKVLQFPAWDCLPYDRISPSNMVLSKRITCLTQLHVSKSFNKSVVILTTIEALLQKTLPHDFLEKQVLYIKKGGRLSIKKLTSYLENNGFENTSTVCDQGEFSLRGGIVDIFAPNSSHPVRLDFFGDEVESIRSFDVDTQKTLNHQNEFTLLPMNEVILTAETISQFRSSYIKNFGAPSPKDALYEAISAGKRFSGMEHWLGLFYEKLETLFDHVKDGAIIYDHLVLEAAKQRYELILDYHKARLEERDNKLEQSPYNPLDPHILYLTPENLLENSNKLSHSFFFSPFSENHSSDKILLSTGVKNGYNFIKERQSQELNLFDTVVDFIKSARKKGKKLLITAWTEGSLERLLSALEEHGLEKIEKINQLSYLKALGKDNIFATILSIENGFETKDLILLTEQDIFGDRLLVQNKKRRKSSNFIKEASFLNAGDIVVHIDHGIGRFIGLKTIVAGGASHDCLEIWYAGDDKLFVPVENIELLSRYSGPSDTVVLDKIGGIAWQARKAKLKKNLLELADHLISIAAKRELKKAPILSPPENIYEEFVNRFPYDETPDQQHAIEDVIEDLTSGKPMDRLICGDVGFGKTEVALRAAFIAALNGYQVAVVVPTTLLARQHYQTFSKRFHGFPLRIGHLSRLVSSKERTSLREELSKGTIDIVIGTHAILSSDVKIKNLGLLIIDEEQHFGVKHKERLKELKSNVHVLTLSATPIPRTLQLALTGARELSLIASAPIDRIAIRTFISPFDRLTIRETLLREYYRGGQSFYVCPRISDLDFIKEFLDDSLPELKVAIAHGQMPTKQLDDVMNAFYDKQYDILLATTIVESGLDVPTANTLIVHRADMLGLAALYQLRGRIGRSKVRAYALFTIPSGKLLTKIAEKRLKVLQSLDSLGAGFQLASHDMEIRGAGNLLGEEQSGHIKEVGFALYQQMLEEAILEIKDHEHIDNSQWSPQINLGVSVIIPEHYIPDLQLRLGLYRRLSDLEDAQSIDAFGAELIDRFGSLPLEVKYLLKIVYIKLLCKRANIEKLEAGDKGVVLAFRNNQFADSVRLVKWIADQSEQAKIRSDQSIFIKRDYKNIDKRFNGVASIVSHLVNLAEGKL